MWCSKSGCPFGGVSGIENHFTKKEDARAFYESKNNKKALKSLSKDSVDNNSSKPSDFDIKVLALSIQDDSEEFFNSIYDDNSESIESIDLIDKNSELLSKLYGEEWLTRYGKSNQRSYEIDLCKIKYKDKDIWVTVEDPDGGDWDNPEDITGGYNEYSGTNIYENLDEAKEGLKKSEKDFINRHMSN